MHTHTQRYTDKRGRATVHTQRHFALLPTGYQIGGAQRRGRVGRGEHTATLASIWDPDTRHGSESASCIIVQKSKATVSTWRVTGASPQRPRVLTYVGFTRPHVKTQMHLQSHHLSAQTTAPAFPALPAVQVETSPAGTCVCAGPGQHVLRTMEKVIEVGENKKQVNISLTACEVCIIQPTDVTRKKKT